MRTGFSATPLHSSPISMARSKFPSRNSKPRTILPIERTAVAITDGNGNVVERYDGLGNAQALDSSGNPYSVSTTSGEANWQFQQQFSGSTFDPFTQLLQSAGTDYAWNILYHGQMYDGIPGVYETPQGAFNPGIQSLLAPERGVVQVAGNPYNPGSVTMPAWIERIEGGFQTVGGAFESLIGAGTSEFGIGIPVAANGVDNFQAGLRELWTGQYVQTYTSQAIQWGAEEVGTSPSTAYNIGEVGNGVIGFAGTLGAELFNDASQGSWAINGLRSLFAVGAGDVGPRTVSLNVLNPEFVPDAITVNRATAFNFLTTYGGRDEAEAVLHMRGIDFTRPVSVVTIAPRTVLQQFVKWGRATGSYFSPVGTNPLEAGIGDAVTRDLVLYSNSEPVTALQSAASDFLYPDEVKVPWTGGGIQFYVPNNGAFIPI